MKKIVDFSNFKITIDVSKLPPLKPRNLISNNTQKNTQKLQKNIRAVDPEMEERFRKVLETGKLIFDTLEKFRIEVEDNGNKLDVKVDKFTFEEVDAMWIGCGKDYDYYDDMSYPECAGNSVLLIQSKRCICISTDIREFILQKGEKVIRYVSTINEIGNDLRSSGFIQTNLGYYALSSINNRDGFLPKQFISSSDEYRLKLLRWTNTYPYGQVKKIKTKVLSSSVNLKKDNLHMKKDNPNLKKWFL